jgi:hypothetical protein
MQKGQKGPMWLQRACLVLYLGTSPIHLRNIALDLNLKTRLASPQFHIAFDDLFETVQRKSGNPRHSLWQQVTGFTALTAAPPQEPLENTSQKHRRGSVASRLESWVQGNTPGTSSVSEGAPGSHAGASHGASSLSNKYQQASSMEGVGHKTEFDREPLRDDLEASTRAPQTLQMRLTLLLQAPSKQAVLIKMVFSAPYGAVKLLKGTETAEFLLSSPPKSMGRPCIIKITGKRRCKIQLLLWQSQTQIHSITGLP